VSGSIRTHVSIYTDEIHALMISLKITALRRVCTIAHKKNPYRVLRCHSILRTFGLTRPTRTHTVCMFTKAN